MMNDPHIGSVAICGFFCFADFPLRGKYSLQYLYLPKEETQMEERILDQAKIREFETYLVREEKSSATREKY